MYSRAIWNVSLCSDSESLSRYVKWCVVSDNEEQKCRAMSEAFSVHQIRPDIQCVQADTSEACMQMVGGGLADVTSVASLDVGDAMQRHRLIGIMAENYPSTSKDN